MVPCYLDTRVQYCYIKSFFILKMKNRDTRFFLMKIREESPPWGYKQEAKGGKKTLNIWYSRFDHSQHLAFAISSLSAFGIRDGVA